MSEGEQLVTGYVKLWPRTIFYNNDSDCRVELKKSLNHPGVYILYEGFDAYYMGKSACLFERLFQYSKSYRPRWNQFSAFVVEKEHLNYVEAIMIAATPRTTNRIAGKGINQARIRLPQVVKEKLVKSRMIL